VESRTLTTDKIRAAVAEYVTERLACFDDMTAKPLTPPDASPLNWTNEMRMTLLLFMWDAYAPRRPN
jgi:hypothetical protein